jgi:hypothetical protein
MTGKPGDLLDRHAIAGQQRDERAPLVPVRQYLPNPARSHTSWNIFLMCLAPSGVPVAGVNTLPVSCHCDPAASRSAAWSSCHPLSGPWDPFPHPGPCTGGSRRDSGDPRTGGSRHDSRERSN